MQSAWRVMQSAWHVVQCAWRVMQSVWHVMQSVWHVMQSVAAQLSSKLLPCALYLTPLHPLPCTLAPSPLRTLSFAGAGMQEEGVSQYSHPRITLWCTMSAV